MNRRVPHHPSSRRRPLYALLILLVIGTGLLWRSGFLPLPVSVAKYGGDALWAIVVFLGFGFLLRTTSTLRLAVIALGVAWAVEFSQLYHATWIDTIRMTTPGRLVLGSTFNGPDLAAYALGILLAALAEHHCRGVSSVRKALAGDGPRQAVNEPKFT